jgi:hypothetical protein
MISGHLPQGNFVQRLWQLQGAYAEAGMREKREAQSKLVRLVLNKGKALA